MSAVLASSVVSQSRQHCAGKTQPPTFHYFREVPDWVLPVQSLLLVESKTEEVLRAMKSVQRCQQDNVWEASSL